MRKFILFILTILISATISCAGINTPTDGEPIPGEVEDVIPGTQTGEPGTGDGVIPGTQTGEPGAGLPRIFEPESNNCEGFNPRDVSFEESEDKAFICNFIPDVCIEMTYNSEGNEWLFEHDNLACSMSPSRYVLTEEGIIATFFIECVIDKAICEIQYTQANEQPEKQTTALTPKAQTSTVINLTTSFDTPYDVSIEPRGANDARITVLSKSGTSDVLLSNIKISDSNSKDYGQGIKIYTPQIDSSKITKNIFGHASDYKLIGDKLLFDSDTQKLLSKEDNDPLVVAKDVFGEPKVSKDHIFWMDGKTGQYRWLKESNVKEIHDIVIPFDIVDSKLETTVYDIVFLEDGYVMLLKNGNKLMLLQRNSNYGGWTLPVKPVSLSPDFEISKAGLKHDHGVFVISLPGRVFVGEQLKYFSEGTLSTDEVIVFIINEDHYISSSGKIYKRTGEEVRPIGNIDIFNTELLGTSKSIEFVPNEILKCVEATNRVICLMKDTQSNNFFIATVN